MFIQKIVDKIDESNKMILIELICNRYNYT